MVKSADTSLALATVFGSQRLIILALPAVAELNVDSALGDVPLDCRLVLSAIEFR